MTQAAGVFRAATRKSDSTPKYGLVGRVGVEPTAR